MTFDKDGIWNREQEQQRNRESVWQRRFRSLHWQESHPFLCVLMRVRALPGILHASPSDTPSFNVETTLFSFRLTPRTDRLRQPTRHCVQPVCLRLAFATIATFATTMPRVTEGNDETCPCCIVSNRPVRFANLVLLSLPTTLFRTKCSCTIEKSPLHVSTERQQWRRAMRYRSLCHFLASGFCKTDELSLGS